MEENIINLIDTLNWKIYDLFPDGEIFFELSSNGHIAVITFCNIVLWNSEDEERNWIEKENKYEPLDKFIIQKANKYIQLISKLKF